MLKQKVVMVICDGLGDRPSDRLGGLTPLEAAATPNLDRLASESECGLMYTLGRGKRPGSDTAHLAIMGYDPDTSYQGRGPIEVAGIGIELQHGDVAFRGNFGTVDANWLIKDRRAGRIRVVEPLAAALDGIEIQGVKFIVRPGTAYRAGVVMRGATLSSAITDADPHEDGARVRTVTPKDGTPEAERTASLLNAFLAQAYEILRDLPFNKLREQNGQPSANFLLLRGAGKYQKLATFQERYGLSACCIAGGGLYKGIGALLGMRVLNIRGATALPDTDVHAKFRAAVQCLSEYDFVFVHVKAADSLAEDGEYELKKEFIEKIDRAASVFLGFPEPTILIVTADHSTPCELGQHSADPVPIMFHGRGVRYDTVAQFNERACQNGGLGCIVGLDVMPQVMNLLGRLPLVGA